jgi:FAD/FMN-containing dehydrogenase
VLSRLAPLRKSNAGYDLKQLFLGSEGTLGLITAASLRLHPAPAQRVTALLGLRSSAAALAFYARARAAFGEAISACELMSDVCVHLYLRHRQEPRWPLVQETPWLLLLEADSASRYFDLDGALNALLEEALASKIVIDGTIAGSDAQRHGLWRIREGIADAMIATSGSLKSDTAVPVAAIPDFIERASNAASGVVPGCIPAPFGHVGDGNIHLNVLPPGGMDAAEFQQRWPDIIAAIAAVALALGGTVSAEHGIGLVKRAALRRMLSPVEHDLMRALKALLDPQSVLNPEKVI